MKKSMCVFLAMLMVLSLAACGTEKQEAPAAVEEGFRPALDTSTSCHITVAGGYDNFEALEAEFRPWSVRTAPSSISCRTAQPDMIIRGSP